MKKHITFLVAIFCLFFLRSNGQQLATAVLKGNLIDVQKLIDQGANVNEHSIKKCFPLMYASRDGDLKIVELLLKNGAKSDTCPGTHIYWDNYPPFYYAIENKQFDVDSQFEVFKLFIESGCDVTQKMGSSLFTYPIVSSAKFGCLDIFNFILEKGVDVSVKDYEGKSALMYFCSSNNYEMIIKLLDKGAVINDTSIIGYTPFMYAAEINGINFKIIDSLIGKGADLNYVNSKNQSAFSLASLHNNSILAILLLENGAKFKDFESEFETNARMNHFSGDYYFTKGDLISSKEYYIKAKQFYNESIKEMKEGKSKVNMKKAGELLISSIAAGVAGGVLSSVSSGQYSFVFTPDYSYAPNYYISLKNKFLLQDFQLSAESSLDEQKAFYKIKIKQFEMTIFLIDGILSCIEKGLTGKELDSCIENIQFPTK